MNIKTSGIAPQQYIHQKSGNYIAKLDRNRWMMQENTGTI